METKIPINLIGFYCLLMICLSCCFNMKAQNYLEQYQAYVDFIQQNSDIEQKVEATTYVKEGSKWIKEDKSYNLTAQYQGSIYAEDGNSQTWKADGIWLILDLEDKDAILSFYQNKDEKLLMETHAEQIQNWQNPSLKKALDSAATFVKADEYTNFYQIESITIGFDKKTNILSYLSQIIETEEAQYKIEMRFKIKRIDEHDWKAYPSYLQFIQQNGKKKWELTPKYRHYTLSINQN